MTEKKLYRSSSDKMVCGVAAGLAEYFNVDPALVRLIFVILALADGIGLLAYVVLCFVMPQRPAAAVNSSSNGSAAKATPTEFEPLGSRGE